MKKKTIIFKPPIELIERVDKLVKTGLYSNRTEALNDAIRMFLEKYSNSNLFRPNLKVKKR